MSISVSVVIPVFNVEKYIEKCASSLFEQDYENMEYVFVNDETPDDSINVLLKVLDQYPHRKGQVKIIDHEKNKGAGEARKTGVLNSIGEYVIHVDSDDWVDKVMISSLVQKAKENDADIVVCDYYINYKTKQFYKSHDIRNFQIKSKENYLKSSLSQASDNSMCTKLCRRSLYDGIVFPNFSQREDGFLSLQLLFKAEKIIYLAQAFFHYNQTNMNSLTKTKTWESRQKEKDDLRKFNIAVTRFCTINKLDKGLLNCHYSSILLNILAVSEGKLDQEVKSIAPEAIKLKYLWSNRYISNIKKIAYSSIFFGFGFFYNFTKIVYDKIFAYKNSKCA